MRRSLHRHARWLKHHWTWRGGGWRAATDMVTIMVGSNAFQILRRYNLRPSEQDLMVNKILESPRAEAIDEKSVRRVTALIKKNLCDTDPSVSGLNLR